MTRSPPGRVNMHPVAIPFQGKTSAGGAPASLRHSTRSKPAVSSTYSILRISSPWLPGSSTPLTLAPDAVATAPSFTRFLPTKRCGFVDDSGVGSQGGRSQGLRIAMTEQEVEVRACGVSRSPLLRRWFVCKCAGSEARQTYREGLRMQARRW
jgi:hypothetical protein